MLSKLLILLTPLVGKALIPLAVSKLTDLYKQLHPPKWLAPFMPYILGFAGSYAYGLSAGYDPETILTYTLGAGGSAVAYYNLQESLTRLWDKYVLKKDTPLPPGVPMPGTQPGGFPAPIDLPPAPTV